MDSSAEGEPMDMTLIAGAGGVVVALILIVACIMCCKKKGPGDEVVELSSQKTTDRRGGPTQRIVHDTQDNEQGSIHEIDDKNLTAAKMVKHKQGDMVTGQTTIDRNGRIKY